MDDGFLLENPDSPQAYLRRLNATVRRKGETLVRVGAVGQLTVETPGQAYSAVVRDGDEFEVDVYATEDDPIGWSGDCSCSEECDCPHVFAVTREVLAQHSAAAVRALSAGPTRAAPARKPRRKTERGELAARLAAALERPLLEQEVTFVKKVQRVHQRCRQLGGITFWDFQEMGLPLKGGYGWDGLRIWPEFPQSEFQFWLYVAHAARQRGLALPPFMEAVTDLREVEEPLAQWQRTLAIEKWRQTLASLKFDTSPAQPPNLGEIDLRLAVTEAELQLAWRRPDQAAFEPIKQAELNQLTSDYQQNHCRLTQEAEWMWPTLGPLLHYGNALRWSRLDADAARMLRHLLRLPSLAGRIVTTQGEPLARPAQPLRWDLVPASGPQDDYRFRLVQADGSPVPSVLAVLPAHPTLYLTTVAVFSGPAFHTAVLDPHKENCIPAPALECAAGVALLHNLGLELPSPLKERVQRLPYQVVIRCELRRPWPGNATEECVVSAEAEAADGRSLTWAGYNWVEKKPQPERKKAGAGLITLYDSSALAETQALLESLQLRPDFFGRGYSTRVTKKFPETFSLWLASVPPHIRVELVGELASLAAVDVAGRVKLDVTETEIDWFDLRVVLDVSDTTLTDEEIALLLKAKGSFVRLSGKGWRRLHFDLTPEENERLAHLGLSAQELSDEPQRLHALQLADAAAKTFLPEPQVERIRRRVDEIKTRVAPPLPAGVTAELRPYQLEGFQFLAYLSANRFGGILADDMGLGKTVQALVWLVWLRQEESRNSTLSAGPSPPPAPAPANSTAIKPSLVVCPKSVMDNWRAEAERFTPGLRVRIWSASELDRFTAELGSADLHVLNYSQLRILGEGLASVSWQALILDEGQYIKNPNSQTAQVARSLHAKERLVLSGTPIENRLLDLWSLMAFAMPGVLGSRPHFARLFGSKEDPFARRRLAARVRPFLLRRTKGQVAKDLPDRIEEDLFCEMEGEQQVLYRAELKRAQQLLLGIKTQKQLAQQQFHFLVSLLRLRQICCDPRLHNPDSTAPSAKTEALLEQLEPLMEEGQKVLVFSQFVELLDLLRPLLKERKWPIFYLAGDTENRGELVRQFQSAEGKAVFLVSLKAGGFGLNLTAASYVVLFDPWWNPAVENQAIDRTHRIGQTNKVIAYRLLIKNSIEEKIRALQKQKKALAEDVLGEERFTQSLTLDDLRFLFAE
jgi:hypothetical protein